MCVCVCVRACVPACVVRVYPKYPHKHGNIQNPFPCRDILWSHEKNSTLIKIGGKFKALQLFNMYLPFSQGTISNWTIDSKAVSWTDVGYSFIISSSIKQVNGLELFVFGSCCSEPTSCGQRSSPCKRNRQLFGFKNTNSSERLGAAQSSVCYIRRKQDRTGELSNIKGLDIHGGQQ